MGDFPLNDADEYRIAIERARRVAIAGALYRWLLGCGFLLVAFREIPEHRPSLALGYLVFNQAMGLIFEQDDLARIISANRLDSGERTTRHAVLLAARRMAVREPLGDDFWPEVRQLVQTEKGAPAKASFWRSCGLVVVNLAGRIIGDVIGIGIVFALSSD